MNFELDLVTKLKMENCLFRVVVERYEGEKMSPLHPSIVAVNLKGMEFQGM